jgi:hypothetical protein
MKKLLALFFMSFVFFAGAVKQPSKRSQIGSAFRKISAVAIGVGAGCGAIYLIDKYPAFRATSKSGVPIAESGLPPMIAMVAAGGITIAAIGKLSGCSDEEIQELCAMGMGGFVVGCFGTLAMKPFSSRAELTPGGVEFDFKRLDQLEEARFKVNEGNCDWAGSSSTSEGGSVAPMVQ